MIFFTSDHHIGHSKILEYCQRPFKDLDEMHLEIIRRWNSVLTDEDTVYHLGDLALCAKTIWQPITQQLKGHKILIKGNHDRHTNKSYYDGGFEKIFQTFTWGKHTDSPMLFQHHPDFNYDKSYFKYHFCGHVHTRWTRKGNIINVGVDKWDFTPRTFEELIQAKEDYPVVIPVSGLIRDNNGGYYAEINQPNVRKGSGE